MRSFQRQVELESDDSATSFQCSAKLIRSAKLYKNVVCVTKFWGVHSPFWSVATIAKKQPSANQFSTLYVLPDFHTTVSIVAHVTKKFKVLTIQ